LFDLHFFAGAVIHKYKLAVILRRRSFSSNILGLWRTEKKIVALLAGNGFFLSSWGNKVVILECF
jgi:hypothetical protein